MLRNVVVALLISFLFVHCLADTITVRSRCVDGAYYVCADAELTLDICTPFCDPCLEVCGTGTYYIVSEVSSSEYTILKYSNPNCNSIVSIEDQIICDVCGGEYLEGYSQFFLNCESSLWIVIGIIVTALVFMGCLIAIIIALFFVIKKRRASQVQINQATVYYEQ